MQRGQKSIETFPNMDPAWFALVEQRVNDKKRGRRFAYDRMAAYVGLAVQDRAARGAPFAANPSTKS